ncbi:hypothetical protein [Sorangium sp. So ce887]|uniref:hypothetical protein n=1 Tax=Sorangium sp. So ce887 TaxID=3133324 RepID=UPI003F63E96C
MPFGDGGNRSGRRAFGRGEAELELGLGAEHLPEGRGPVVEPIAEIVEAFALCLVGLRELGGGDLALGQRASADLEPAEHGVDLLQLLVGQATLHERLADLLRVGIAALGEAPSRRERNVRTDTMTAGPRGCCSRFLKKAASKATRRARGLCEVIHGWARRCATLSRTSRGRSRAGRRPS